MRADHGAAAVILILGANAAYFLSEAGPQALAALSRGLITMGLAGLAVLAAVLAVRLLSARGDGGPGRGRLQPEPMSAPPVDDLDGELFSMIDEEHSRQGSG